MLILDILMKKIRGSFFQMIRLMSQQMRRMLIQRRTTFIAVSARRRRLIQDHSFYFEISLKSSAIFLFRKVNHEANGNSKLAVNDIDKLLDWEPQRHVM